MYRVACKTGWTDDVYYTEAEAQARVNELGPAK